MATKKQVVGKGALDILSPTAAGPEKDGAAVDSPGPDRWEKVTTILYLDQIDFLDDLTRDIKRATGAKVRRSEIIRAMIEATRAAGVNIGPGGAIESKTDLGAALMALLSGKPPRP